MVYDELMLKVKTAPSLSEKATILRHNSEKNIAIFPKNEFKKVITELINECEENELIYARCDLICVLVLIEVTNNNIEIAKQLINDSISKNKILKVENRIYIEGLLLFIYLATGEYYKAIKLGNSLIEKYSEQINYIDLIKIYTRTANSYERVRNHSRSLSMHLKALEIAKKNKLKKFEVGVYGNIGILYKNKREFDLSESFHKKGFFLAKKIDFKIEIARQASNISSISLLQNDFKKAIKFSKLSYNLALEICQYEIAACSSLNLGSGYFSVKKYEQSLEFYNISLKLIKQVNQLFLFPPIYKALMDYFYYFKNFKKAFYYQKLYNEFTQKYEGVKQKERIVGLELKYSIVEKNNEILQLTAENQANVLKINEVLQQHENEKRNQANRIELQLREELAHKLHNNVASTLVSTKMYLEELAQSGRLSSDEKSFATKALTQLNATYKDMRQLAQEIKEIDHRDLKKELGQLIALYSSLPNLTFKSQVNIATPIEGDFVIDTLGIIKELMTNALKHSMANQFILKVDVNSKRLNLVFKFNGEKFDGTNTDKQSSGYQSIRNYLQKYDGAIKHTTNSLFSIIDIKTSLKEV